MNSVKKLTSAFDKQKLHAYKQFLKGKNAEGGQAALPAGEARKSYYVTDGPQLYVSSLLNKKGPLTSKQMWLEYQRDQQAKERDMLPSISYLKKKIIASMLDQGKLERAGYSRVKEKFFGYKLVPQKAFKNVHPEIVANLTPKVDVTPRRPRGHSEEGASTKIVFSTVSPRLSKLSNPEDVVVE